MTDYKGIVFKALSGFYYVRCDEAVISCRARGRFRKDGISPLVGDEVIVTSDDGLQGTVVDILPRRNAFVRPPIANLDYLVILVSGAIPVTDPYLVDRLTAIAANAGCESIICINKSDLARPMELYETYSRAGFQTLFVSAKTGEGIEKLKELIAGKRCAFTGNSGVGKSSLINAMDPTLSIATNVVSQKLGRGKHTTRHVELFPMQNGSLIADTPGFSAFDTEKVDTITPEQLPYTFPEFEPYLDGCQFVNCAHTKEKGCAVLEAVQNGQISKSRHESYIRMAQQLRQIKPWDQK